MDNHDAILSDGGPAFPDSTWPSKGMTLRDWFAGMALQAVIGKFVEPNRYECLKLDIQGGMWEAKVAYAWADAMLAERKK
jgi:hypothetical protein